MISVELAGRIQRGSRIILGTGLQLDQDDEGAIIVSVAPGISAIGVQDGDTAATSASRLVFQGSVLSVDPETGIATLNLDGRYQQLPPSGYAWLAGGSIGSYHQFSTPSGYIRLGPANTGFAHIYTDRPSFYFNAPILVNGTAVSMVGHTHAWSQITSGKPSTLGGYGITDGVTHDSLLRGTLDASGTPDTFADDGIGIAIISASGFGWPNALGTAVTLGTRASRNFQLWHTKDDGDLYFRHYNSGTGWQSWEKFAFQSWVSAGFAGGGGFTINQNLRTSDDVTFYGIAMQGNFNRATGPFSFLNGSGGAQSIMTGGVLVSNSYGDIGLVPTNGMWVAGDARFSGANGIYIEDGWCRVSKDGKGLYNEAASYHFYADSVQTRWVSRSDTGIELRDTQSTIRGYVYFSGGNFGLLGMDGGWAISVSDVGGRIGYGTTPDATYEHSFAGDLLVTSGWVRIKGNVGVYFHDWAGGWFMQDATYIRAYNDKHIRTGGNVYAARFYDVTNITYYLDPASTSPLNIVDAQILRIQGSPVAPTIVSTSPPGDVSIYPVGTQFIVHA
jgi:hypothetical protein